MSEKEKLENSREIARQMVIAYNHNANRANAIKSVQELYPTLSYADAELMWMAIDEFSDYCGI